MPDELLDRLVDEMAGFELPFYFSPFKVSEPLLDKRLFGLLERMNEKAPQARIRIFTNGSALTWQNVRNLGWVRNLELWVSFNEHREREYEALMGIPYARTVENLDRLHEVEFPHPVTLTKVGPSDGFKGFCADRWPKFHAVLIKQDGWLGFTEAHNVEIPDTPCARWFELSIMANGICSHCCMDGQGTYPIGDLNEQTLLEVYNSPHWRDRRERMISRREVHPCSTCSY